MPSTYSSNLKIELIATGSQSGTWGDSTNTNLGTALEQAIVGYGNPNFTSDANLTLTLTDSNASQTARNLALNVTSSVSLTATRELVVPTIQKPYIVRNNTTGGQSITVKTTAGTGITVPNGKYVFLYTDGTNVVSALDHIPALTLATSLAAAYGGTGLSAVGTTGNVLTSNGSAWVSSAPAGGGATGGGTDEVFVENQLIVTTSYTLSTGKSAMSVGPVTINGGVVVTIPSGYRWVVL